MKYLYFKKKFWNNVDLLLITNSNYSHVLIKIFDRTMTNKTDIMVKDIFAGIAYNAIVCNVSLTQKYLNVTQNVFYKLTTQNQFTSRERYTQNFKRLTKALFITYYDLECVKWLFWVLYNH